MPKNRIIRRTAPTTMFSVLGNIDVSGDPDFDPDEPIEWVHIADCPSLAIAKHVKNAAKDIFHTGTTTPIYDSVKVYNNELKGFVNHPSLGD